MEQSCSEAQAVAVSATVPSHVQVESALDMLDDLDGSRMRLKVWPPSTAAFEEQQGWGKRAVWIYTMFLNMRFGFTLFLNALRY